jgi:cell division transport system permease protein
MTRLFYLFRKFVSNLIGRPLPAATSLLSLLLLFFMLDMVWIASLSADNYFDQIVDTIEMDVFLKENVNDSSVAEVTNVIINYEGVNDLRYISKEDAREKLMSLMGTDLLEGIEENPLPVSFVIYFQKRYITSEYLQAFEENLRSLPQTGEVYYPRTWLSRSESTRSLISNSVIFLGGLIYLAVVLNLLYSIRLSVKTREEEIGQFRLMGAGRTFLAVPYIIEGLFYAITAAVGGWLIIYFLSGHLTFGGLEIILPIRNEIINFCLVALGIGMISGYIGIRRSL